ncbi:hypothetical protein [Poseidonocella sp. HB161398]|uniref:hypothetical protein n=1 Tax=Poseidonocella sp. HB161398 TaxID=2320855 RepID=UPI001109DA7D|nr:hypothetical protein [Poseidonocella sp. HB161398]
MLKLHIILTGNFDQSLLDLADVRISLDRTRLSGIMRRDGGQCRYQLISVDLPQSLEGLRPQSFEIHASAHRNPRCLARCISICEFLERRFHSTPVPSDKDAL